MQQHLKRYIFTAYAMALHASTQSSFAQESYQIKYPNFMPHGFCLNWDPTLLKVMILSNVGIAVAYFAIPAALWYFVRHKKDLPYPWMFYLFAMFIIACGITHIVKVWTLYQPFYWFEAGVDSYTAIISLITAFALWPLIPKALQLRSPKELEVAYKKLEQSVIRDREITAELQAQAELLNLTHDAIVVADINGTIRYWSSGGQEVYGYTAEQAVGKNSDELLKTEFSSPKEEIQRELIEKGRWDGELVKYNSNGRQLIVASRQALKRDSNGNPIAVLAISSDITEHKRAEQRRLALAEMERSNADLQQFAYIASHDLQEPLRAIAGCLQILEKTYKGKLDNNADQLIGHAVDGAVRMRILISDLLALSHVNSKGLSPELTKLTVVLETVRQNLSVPIQEKNAIITYNDLPSIVADKTQLTQLFQNLINNAIKFCKNDQPKIHINVKHEETHWLVSISDNGIGFEQEYADKIFQPFKRLHSRDEFEGTGIGLAICKKIVERHGGKIWVQSELNKGTTFYFTIADREQPE